MSRLAAGVDIQQLGGYVADFFRGLALGLFPLIRAQAMQRRGLVRRAGVATDQVQRGYRHIQFVLLGVLQGQVFLRHAADIQGLQPQVATDTVLFVHHRRADLQFSQVAHHLVGIRALAAATALLHALAEQQRLGHHGNLGLMQPQAGFDGRGGDAQRGFVLEEGLPAVDGVRLQLEAAQGFDQRLAAASRFGDEQHPAWIVAQELT